MRFDVMPYESIVLGLKFQIRVRDLTARDVLVTTCKQCHRKWNVAPHHLYAKYHQMMPILDVEKDMRCKSCGSRDFAWHIMRAVGPEVSGWVPCSPISLFMMTKMYASRLMKPFGRRIKNLFQHSHLRLNWVSMLIKNFVCGSCPLLGPGWVSTPRAPLSIRK